MIFLLRSFVYFNFRRSNVCVLKVDWGCWGVWYRDTQTWILFKRDFLRIFKDFPQISKIFLRFLRIFLQFLRNSNEFPHQIELPAIPLSQAIPKLVLVCETKQFPFHESEILWIREHRLMRELTAFSRTELRNIYGY